MSTVEKQGQPKQLFAVTIKELADGPKQIDREIPLGWLAAELSSCEYRVTPTTAAVSLAIESSSGGVLVRGEARASVATECGICLAKTALELHPSIDAFMMPRAEGEQEEGDLELTPEELAREWYDGDRVVLDELIRDGIMLELPMTPRCSNSCTNELVVVEETTEPTVDPRLAPLANIKLSKE